MDRKELVWPGGVAAVVVVALVLWLTLDHGGDTSHAPAAITKVADWMREEDECVSVDVEASPIPVGANGPPGTFFEMFGELPEVGALAGCEVASGFIGWFRFGSAAAMRAALRRHPELTSHELTCTKGDQLLIDSLLGYDKMVPEYCRRLGFEVHRPMAGPTS
jgi:hypothetical protein